MSSDNARQERTIIMADLYSEALATFARLLYDAPLNPKAYDLIDPAFARRLSSYPAKPF